jgi:hypothetical protein
MGGQLIVGIGMCSGVNSTAPSDAVQMTPIFRGTDGSYS